MTGNSNPMVTAEDTSVDETPANSVEHFGASPRPRNYHGRHRRSRNADR